MKATKPHERIYFTSFGVKTQDEGDMICFIALDEYSDYLYKPFITPDFKDINDMINAFVSFFNGINENYNRKIHAQSTIFITDLDPEIHPIAKSIIMKEDSLVYNPEKTKKKLEPIIKKMGFS